jgi:hypothetical protein
LAERETRELAGEGVAVSKSFKLLQRPSLLGVHSSIGGMVQQEGCNCNLRPKPLGRCLGGTGGSICEYGFLIFWLVYLEVATSLRVTRATSFDARLVGGESYHVG